MYQLQVVVFVDLNGDMKLGLTWNEINWDYGCGWFDAQEAY